jgi:hypothetical protein
MFYALFGLRMGNCWGQPGTGVKLNAGNAVSLVCALPRCWTPGTLWLREPWTTLIAASEAAGDPEAEQIPKFKDAVKSKAEWINKRIQREWFSCPTIARPWAGGLTPLLVQFSAQGGEGGLSFGEGISGPVRVCASGQSRISNNWLVSPSVRARALPLGLRTFNILRDGTIADGRWSTSGSEVDPWPCAVLSLPARRRASGLFGNRTGEIFFTFTADHDAAGLR